MIKNRSKVLLYQNIPLKMNDDNTFYWKNQREQSAFFNNWENKREFYGNYIWDDVESLEINISYKDAGLYNYLSFWCEEFGRIFYTFITRIRFVAPGITRFEFQLDVIQSYFFDCNFQKVQLARLGAPNYVGINKFDRLVPQIPLSLKYTDYLLVDEGRNNFNPSYGYNQEEEPFRPDFTNDVVSFYQKWDNSRLVLIPLYVYVFTSITNVLTSKRSNWDALTGITHILGFNEELMNLPSETRFYILNTNEELFNQNASPTLIDYDYDYSRYYDQKGFSINLISPTQDKTITSHTMLSYQKRLNRLARTTNFQGAFLYQDSQILAFRVGIKEFELPRSLFANFSIKPGIYDLNKDDSQDVLIVPESAKQPIMLKLVSSRFEGLRCVLIIDLNNILRWCYSTKEAETAIKSWVVTDFLLPIVKDLQPEFLQFAGRFKNSSKLEFTFSLLDVIREHSNIIPADYVTPHSRILFPPYTEYKLLLGNNEFVLDVPQLLMKGGFKFPIEVMKTTEYLNTANSKISLIIDGVVVANYEYQTDSVVPLLIEPWKDYQLATGPITELLREGSNPQKSLSAEIGAGEGNARFWLSLISEIGITAALAYVNPAGGLSGVASQGIRSWLPVLAVGRAAGQVGSFFDQKADKYYQEKRLFNKMGSFSSSNNSRLSVNSMSNIYYYNRRGANDTVNQFSFKFRMMIRVKTCGNYNEGSMFFYDYGVSYLKVLLHKFRLSQISTGGYLQSYHDNVCFYLKIKSAELHFSSSRYNISVPPFIVNSLIEHLQAGIRFHYIAHLNIKEIESLSLNPYLIYRNTAFQDLIGIIDPVVINSRMPSDQTLLVGNPGIDSIRRLPHYGKAITHDFTKNRIFLNKHEQPITRTYYEKPEEPISIIKGFIKSDNYPQQTIQDKINTLDNLILKLINLIPSPWNQFEEQDLRQCVGYISAIETELVDADEVNIGHLSEYLNEITELINKLNKNSNIPSLFKEFEMEITNLILYLKNDVRLNIN